MADNCRICGNAAHNRVHTAREMMFGTREEFAYLECDRCGTLQLIVVPDLTPHYPDEYYAHRSVGILEIDRGWRRQLAARLIARHLLGFRSRIGAALTARRPWIAKQFPPYLRGLSGRIDFNSAILDYGCGDGELLRTLRVFGFRKLTGADKFIGGDISFGDIKIYKRGLGELRPFFDLVMLHHSFEHLPRPQKALTDIKSLLSPRGLLLIRIPLANFAWEKYGVNWVQLDPPRHLFLYTEQAFRQLAEEAGFAVERVVYDSESFQFYASEQYQNDIPLSDPRSFRGVGPKSIFDQPQIDEWEAQAKQLNAKGLGDQACFYLTMMN